MKNLINCLLSICILCLGSNTIFAQNAVLNGSFTASAANWTFFAPGTTTEAYNGETSYGGTVAANIVAEVDNQANLRQTNIPVTAGQTYGISFRHTRRTGNGAAPNPSVIIVKVYDGATTYVNQTITSNNATWNWQCKYFSFTPTGTTVSIDFENVTATTLGTIVDDITVAPEQQTVTVTGLSCQGGTLVLDAPNFPGNPNSNYTNYAWTGPGGATGTGSSLTLSNLQSSHEGIYTCTMLLNGCFPATATYNVIVSPNEFNRTATICAGSVYHFYGQELTVAGNYQTLISGGGVQCDSLVKLQLNVQAIPNAEIRPSPSINICLGEEALLQAVDDRSGVTYQWYRNNAPIASANTSSHRTTTAGDFRLTATINGCADTSDITVVAINPNPNASIIRSTDSVLCTKDTMGFSVAIPSSTNRYAWEPKNAFTYTTGHEGSEVKGVLDFQNNKISVTVTDANGCVSKDSIWVNTVSCCEMMMPNAFTPNGDGKNDFFKPHLDVGQRVMTFEVYDRYGSVVYGNYVGNNTLGWDGNYRNGKSANLGVYMYFLRYLCSDGKIYTRKGEVSLYR